MADAIHLEVTTPERLLVREDVTEVSVPGKEGYLGILPGHAALLGMLGSGFLSYPSSGKTHYIAIHGGFLEVNHDHVRVLADYAERAEEIDVARAQEDLRRFQEQISTPAVGVDPAEALNQIVRAQTLIDTAAKK